MKSENKPMRGYVAVLVVFALVVVGIFGYRGYIHYRETHPVWPDMAEVWEDMKDVPEDATVQQLDEMGYRDITQIQQEEIEEISKFFDSTQETGKRVLILAKDTAKETKVGGTSKSSKEPLIESLPPIAARPKSSWADKAPNNAAAG